MSKLARIVTLAGALALAATSSPAAAATAPSAMATLGANSAILRTTQVTACDGENDAYGVAAQVLWRNNQIYTYNNFDGAVTCKTFSFGGGFDPRAVRVCETLRRTGISVCGAWAYRSAPPA